jgi:hypothetical protein
VAFASTVILGFGPPSGLMTIFLFVPRPPMCFEMRFPLRRQEGSDYYCQLPPTHCPAVICGSRNVMFVCLSYLTAVPTVRSRGTDYPDRVFLVNFLSDFTISIYLWLYSPCGPWPLFQFLNLHTVGRTPWTGKSSSREAATYTQNNTNRINAYRHPCLVWDSNPRSQCSSGRRRFMP